MAARSRGDLFARIIGFLVFLLGIAAIVGVLWLAFDMWRDPNLGLRTAGGTPAAPNLQQVGVGFGQLIIRIVLLFLGSLSGSLIANKGINLYFTGLHAGAPVVEHVEHPAPPELSAEQKMRKAAGK